MEPPANLAPTSGYTAGGVVQPLLRVNTIDKFPFAADANATDVGDLTQQRAGAEPGPIKFYVMAILQAAAHPGSRQ